DDGDVRDRDHRRGGQAGVHGTPDLPAAGREPRRQGAGRNGRLTGRRRTPRRDNRIRRTPAGVRGTRPAPHPRAPSAPRPAPRPRALAPHPRAPSTLARPGPPPDPRPASPLPRRGGRSSVPGMERGGGARPGAGAPSAVLAAVLLAGLPVAGCGSPGADKDTGAPSVSAAAPSPRATSAEDVCVRLVTHWSREVLGGTAYGDYQSMGLSNGQYEILRAAVAAARPVRERQGTEAAHR